VPEAIYGGAAWCIRVIADEIRPLAPCSSPEWSVPDSIDTRLGCQIG
jgi:hypothetical protein